MKPVSVRGIFDHSKEIRVEKMRNGEKGFDMVTPFYTHNDAQGRPCAILVNRGWVPFDLRDQNLHRKTTAGTIHGILYQGDAQNKWSLPNSPTIDSFTSVRPSDFALIDQLPNEKEASQFMLHQIDFDPNARQIHPTVPTVQELTQFRVSAERNGAYESLWRNVTFLGIAANTFLWLGF